MKIHSQNLNDDRRGNPVGSMFWHGRAWLSDSAYRWEYGHIEWLFGSHAKDFAVTAGFGVGDSDCGLQLHLCIPWLFSVYLTLTHFIRCQERRTGIAIHNGAFWVYPFIHENESRSDWSWWKKAHAFHFPWTLDHHNTEILAEGGGVGVVSVAVPLHAQKWPDPEPHSHYLHRTYDMAGQVVATDLASKGQHLH